MMIRMSVTLIDRPTSGATEDELATQLHDVRTRTRRLTEDLSTRQLMGPMLPIVNPVLWEIGHVGWFHEYWTLRHAHGEAPGLDRADVLWNSSTVAHATRWDLNLPDRNGVFAYMADVLGRQVGRLSGGVDAGTRYFYELSIRHEDMHVEALAYTRQTLGYARPDGLGHPANHNAGPWPGDASVSGGRWRLGSTGADGFIFDNEKWAHEVGIAPFRIAKAPVTNAEFAAFVRAGGYRNRQFWSAAGWAWREGTGAERPVYWLETDGGYGTWRRYQEVEPLAPHAPVMFVNWYEAEAWCRWAKRRLPTEAEWEDFGASADPMIGNQFDEAGAVVPRPGGGIFGDTWEWTRSAFDSFPGFETAAGAVGEYNGKFMCGQFVLKGASCATPRGHSRASYRNFFPPAARWQFTGVRLAKDA